MSDIFYTGNNQRLEFLGDSVLHFCVTQFLYQHFPDHQEGPLTVSSPEFHRSHLFWERFERDLWLKEKKVVENFFRKQLYPLWGCSKPEPAKVSALLALLWKKAKEWKGNAFGCIGSADRCTVFGWRSENRWDLLQGLHLSARRSGHSRERLARFKESAEWDV